MLIEQQWAVSLSAGEWLVLIGWLSAQHEPRGPVEDIWEKMLPQLRPLADLVFGVQRMG